MSESINERAERLLRAHWGETAWDGDLEAVKRLNPALWDLYVTHAYETFENSPVFRQEIIHGNEDSA